MIKWALGRKVFWIAGVADERMPGMSGTDLLERVRRDYPRVVRIMLTGEASLEASIRAVRGGVDSFLTKPIVPSEQCRVISAALIRRSLDAGERPEGPHAVPGP